MFSFILYFYLLYAMVRKTYPPPDRKIYYYIILLHGKEKLKVFILNNFDYIL